MAEVKKYVMRYNVRHGEKGKVWELPAGAECPSEILQQMLALGHAELYKEKAPAPAPAAKVSQRVTQPKPAPDAAEEDGDIEPSKK